jgi:sodium/hydrogen exchanger 8
MFRSILGVILLLAVFGTLVSSFAIGGLLQGAVSAGWFSSWTDIGIVESDDYLHFLLFGTLLSAVDPIATLSILGSDDVGAPPTLYALVFGESLLVCAVDFAELKTFCFVRR